MYWHVIFSSSQNDSTIIRVRTPTITYREVKESLLDIRSRIQCKLFDFGDGVCPYGDKVWIAGMPVH
jgi:hypothetical protein